MSQLAAWIGIAIPLVLSTIVLTGVLRQQPSLRHYLVFSKKLKRRQFVATLTASNAALANILFLFTYWGYIYGTPALLWGATFWGVGLFYFAILAKRTRLAQLMNPGRPELGLNEVIGRSFDQKHVLVAAAIVSALAYLFLLSLELNVGSKVFATFVPASPQGTPFVMALVLGVFMAIYAGVGGFPLVVRTDVLQLFFVLGAVVAVPITIDALLPAGTSLWSLLAASWATNPIFEFSWSYVPFVVGSLFSWGVWFTCTMDMWQRAVAVDSPKQDIGRWGLLPGYVLLLLVTASAVLMGVFVKANWTAVIPPAYPLVDFVQMVFTAAETNQIAAFGLAFIIAGFVAALLSTVDTYLIIVSHSIAGDIWAAKKGWLSDLATGDSGREILRRVRFVSVCIPLAAVGLFWLSETIFKQNTFTLYMIAGSIPMALVPVVHRMFGIRTKSAAPVFPKATHVAGYMLFAALAGVVTNFFLANRALTTFDPRHFGLLFFVPAAVALIAGIPFLRNRH